MICLNSNILNIACLNSEQLHTKMLDDNVLNLDNAPTVYGYVAQLVRAPHS